MIGNGGDIRRKSNGGDKSSNTANIMAMLQGVLMPMLQGVLMP